MTAGLIITAAALGVGLAMDAFSVSLANGLADQNMKKKKMLTIAGTFAVFQFVMPMTGWLLVTRAAEKFEWFRPFIPWIALVLLLIIGGGLLKDGIEEERNRRKNGNDSAAGSRPAGEAPASEGGGPAAAAENTAKATGTENKAAATEPDNTAADRAGAGLTTAALMMQGVATSIDALSVGFTIASYGIAEALISSLIIGIETLFICLAGLRLGRKLGTLLAGKASLLGGVILIAIGFEIWIKGVFL